MTGHYRFTAPCATTCSRSVRTACSAGGLRTRRFCAALEFSLPLRTRSGRDTRDIVRPCSRRRWREKERARPCGQWYSHAFRMMRADLPRPCRPAPISSQSRHRLTSGRGTVLVCPPRSMVFMWGGVRHD